MLRWKWIKGEVIYFDSDDKGVMSINELAKRIAFNEQVILPHITPDNPEYANFVESIEQDKKLYEKRRLDNER